jgi:maltose alpha-D-glucosyltransferase/alpha-amylase
MSSSPAVSDSLWYKNAVIYELHVKSFRDSDDDGIGDFPGLIEKLDYLKDLGVSALWLLPFCSSPLRDDGYDIADYYSIQEEYGTLSSFKRFLKEAHRRRLRVITELVVNHTSDQHPWFQRARRSKPGSLRRNYYLWSDTPDKFREARIIFKDFETSNWTWDPVAKAYYFHRFYSHQPDLNYDNPHIQREVLRVVNFWLSLGVDGLRLDAVPYLFKREGTNCENLPETHTFLKKLRSFIDSRYSGRVLIAEANQWPEDAVAYFGTGDECHMAFHFPVMPRLFMSLGLEDQHPVMDILRQIPFTPETCQWVTFLRNHDELTLEMVTDEERTFMYHSYAKDLRARINLGIRRRLAPLLGNNRRTIELMNALLFSLPGTPVIYYGDEIGMGDNYYLGDRHGVRTPMQWSPDRNAGFSRASPQRLDLPVIIEPEYHYEALNVENQTRNIYSLLWWMKRIIAMRKRFTALGRGSIEFLVSENPKILAFVRRLGDEAILVAANLSRFPQHAEIDLSQYPGFIPQDVFGGNEFPVIKKDVLYPLSLGSYDYYWLQLRPPREEITVAEPESLPEMAIDAEWRHCTETSFFDQLASVLPDYLNKCRWFEDKHRKLLQTRILDTLLIPVGDAPVALVYIETIYKEGLPNTYALLIGYQPMEAAHLLQRDAPQAIIAKLRIHGGAGLIHDALYSESLRHVFAGMIAGGRAVRADAGVLEFRRGETYKKLRGDEPLPRESRIHSGEHSNFSIFYGTAFHLKLYRKLDEGVNPETEIARYLTDGRQFPHTPPYAGELRWLGASSEPRVIGYLQGQIFGARDYWGLTLDELERFYERILSSNGTMAATSGEVLSFFNAGARTLPKVIDELVGGVYLRQLMILGRQTAEMHEALGAPSNDPDFAPEPFTVLYQRSVFHAMSSSMHHGFSMLRRDLNRLPDSVRQEAARVLAAEKTLVDLLRRIMHRRIRGVKIRVHGDYRLHHIIYNGNNFLIVGFGSDPLCPQSERRIKRSPLYDAITLVRSLHNAAMGGLLLRPSIRREDVARLQPWALVWYYWSSAAFLHAYREAMLGKALLPETAEDTEVIFTALLLERMACELIRALGSNPEWAIVPLSGMLHVLQTITPAPTIAAAEAR